MKRHFRKLRDRLATRFFNTRYGRELLIHGIGPRTLSMTVDCGDHVMTFSPSDYIGRKVFRKGHFERDHVTRLLTIMQNRGLPTDGKVLLEIGGNIGTQTVYFALSKAFTRIVSVEPDPRNFKLLQLNIAQNDLNGNVTPVRCAAGDSEGEIEFFQHLNNHGKSSMMRRSPKDVSIFVPVKPVTRILQEYGIVANDVGLVWMDIEGYEPVAIGTMQELMSRRVPIYTEFTSEFYGPETARKFVEMLSSFYENCLIFLGDEISEIKVREIPLNREQFDVLLLP
ncbi:methyltransferase, FkbM family domain protein [Brucella grignonensis]|uniref:Methyltransferase, FkbM family domain protein n=1 Tax=Brucella grignonensis TaxID=94627 RepID=A0A256F114_9HYPH|nr:FkbM family methyltransferase [Brucella grignonensis]OYR08578.1 methyltransferase, FkbM family domain protein [Brucella grignonensis]